VCFFFRRKEHTFDAPDDLMGVLHHSTFFLSFSFAAFIIAFVYRILNQGKIP